MLASLRLRSDKHFVRRAIEESNHSVLRFVDDKLLNDGGFILELLSTFDSGLLSFIPNELKDDESFMKQAIELNTQAVVHASHRLRKGIFSNLCLQDLSSSSEDEDYQMPSGEDSSVSSYSSEEEEYGSPAKSTFENPELLLHDLRTDSHALQLAPLHLQNDKMFLLECIKVNPLSFNHFPQHLKDDTEYKLDLLTNNIEVFPLMDQDREFIMKAVSTVKGVYSLLSEELKEDKEILLTALQLDNSIPIPNSVMNNRVASSINFFHWLCNHCNEYERFQQVFPDENGSLLHGVQFLSATAAWRKDLQFGSVKCCAHIFSAEHRTDDPRYLFQIMLCSLIHKTKWSTPKKNCKRLMLL